MDASKLRDAADKLHDAADKLEADGAGAVNWGQILQLVAAIIAMIQQFFPNPTPTPTPTPVPNK